MKQFEWSTISWTATEYQFTIIQKTTGEKVKKYEYLTPQAPLIENASSHAKYLWAKSVVSQFMSSSPTEDNFYSAKEGSTEQLHDASEDTKNGKTPKRTGISLKKMQKKAKPVNLRRIWGWITSSVVVKRPAESIYDLDYGISGVGSLEKVHVK